MDAGGSIRALEVAIDAGAIDAAAVRCRYDSSLVAREFFIEDTTLRVNSQQAADGVLCAALPATSETQRLELRNVTVFSSLSSSGGAYAHGI
jgi:hypothetical protein